jgi:glyoxylase I family protein
VVTDQPEWLKTLMLHPTGMVVAFQQHTGNSGETFDYTVTGMDHFGFGVGTAAELEGWIGRFEELGVTHSPVRQTELGQFVSFEDPDGIQLELFYSPLADRAAAAADLSA